LIVNGKTSQGVNDFGEEVLPKGKKILKKFMLLKILLT
jgi:hypothetical protein